MLVVHFDYASLPAAVAVLRVGALDPDGAMVGYHGIDPLGVDATLPATLEQLAGFERSVDRAHELGLAAVRPRLRPTTFAAHLVGEVADDAGCGHRWRQAVFGAVWEDGADVGDRTVLHGLARWVGLAAIDVDAVLDDPARRGGLRQRMLRARQRGVGDVPVLEVDGTLVSAELSDDDLRSLLAG